MCDVTFRIICSDLEQQRRQGRVHGSSADHGDEPRSGQDVRDGSDRSQGQEDREATRKTLGAGD